MPDGALGVRVVFVIRGYIITRLLLLEERARGTVSLRRFYPRRVLRIIPAFWLYLAVIFLLSRLGLFVIQFGGDIVSPGTFACALPFWKSGRAWETGHAWSLSIEEQFYLLWPAVFMPCSRRMRVVVAAAVVAGGPFVCWSLHYHPDVIWSGLWWLTAT